MASIAGRAVIVTKTNKSGGALAKGDVVVVDSANDNAVTTTTAGATTVTVGVVVVENGIANNASGRVQFGGHVALVNVNASVTRGHYGATHTVAKQATDAGASRVVGTCMIFTTGGTTPEADLFTQPDASSATGNMATDALWDAKGDMALGTGANTGAKLTAGANGKVPTYASGETTGMIPAFPPGYELDYAEITSNVSVTGNDGAPTTLITGNSVTWDGGAYMVECFSPVAIPQATANAALRLWIWVDNAQLDKSELLTPVTTQAERVPMLYSRRMTLSAGSHQLIAKGSTTSGTATFGAGAGTLGNFSPAYLRITKV